MDFYTGRFLCENKRFLLLLLFSLLLLLLLLLSLLLLLLSLLSNQGKANLLCEIIPYKLKLLVTDEVFFNQWRIMAKLASCNTVFSSLD